MLTMDFTLYSATRGLELSTPEWRMATVPTPARNIGRYPANKSDWAFRSSTLTISSRPAFFTTCPSAKGSNMAANMERGAERDAGDGTSTSLKRITSGFPLFLVDSNNQSGVNFQWNGTPLTVPARLQIPLRLESFQPTPILAARLFSPRAGLRRTRRTHYKMV